MLALDQSALLLDALRPPPGMQIDIAVGCTFPLDLAAILAIPVAASFADIEEEREPAGVLEMIRRHSDRTLLFCQAGAIAVPQSYRAALTFVERSVIEVKRPSGGIFHPKAWALRFRGGGLVCHRVLVMSRNMTFDRALDVIVRLDEDPGAARAVATDGYIAFLRDVRRRAARPLSDHQSKQLDDLTRSLALARLAVPEPFEGGRFVPLLARGDGTPFRTHCDRALAISPFLTARAVEGLRDSATEDFSLVSRRAALDSVRRSLGSAQRVYRPKDLLLDAQDSVEGSDKDVDDASPSSRGLHAKVYVQDVGDNSTVWLGSANLTYPAFHSNVELMLQLEGRRRDVGVDVLLTPDPTKNNLSWIIEPHVVTDDEVGSDDQIDPLEAHAYDIASSSITVALMPDGELFTAQLHIDPWEPPLDISVDATLLTLDDKLDNRISVIDGRAEWSGLGRSHITPFVVIRITSGPAIRRVLVRAHLIGDPEDRRNGVIADAIASRSDFLHYLAALLGIDTGWGFWSQGTGGESGNWLEGAGGEQVLENLLTTASRNPERLKTLDLTYRRLVKRSSAGQTEPQTADLTAIIPAEFHALWEAVRSARGDEIG